jgi:hypothetical protein
MGSHVIGKAVWQLLLPAMLWLLLLLLLRSSTLLVLVQRQEEEFGRIKQTD